MEVLLYCNVRSVSILAEKLSVPRKFYTLVFFLIGANIKVVNFLYME